MEVRRRFKVEDEEHYEGIMQLEKCSFEIWELYDSETGELIRRDA